MNLSEHFTRVFTRHMSEYPDHPPVSKHLWMYMPRYLYSTVEGVKKQFDRIQGNVGTIAFWNETSDNTFDFATFCVDKTTMYFDKVSFEAFWNSFVDNRPEVKRELSSMMRLDMEQELKLILQEEYTDNYDHYLSELLQHKGI